MTATGYIVLPGIGSMPINAQVAPRNDVRSGMDSLIEMDAGMNPGDIVRKPLMGTGFRRDTNCVVPV